MRLSIPHPLTANSSNCQSAAQNARWSLLRAAAMQPRNSRAVEPLAGNTRYQKVGLAAEPPDMLPGSLICILTSSHVAMQLRDLNKGTFGFVQLALDTDSNTQVAIKFIERGDKVGCNALQSALKHSGCAAVWQGA